MREQAVSFGARQSLIGVVTWPSAFEGGQEGSAAPRAAEGVPAVLLLNAGILHRIGPNRIYVKIARSLAVMGFAVLRFDFSGIGDSPPRDDLLPFEQAAVEETQQGMATLRALAGGTQFLLVGLCSGARVALDTALSDPRVAGAMLINATMHLHDSRSEELGQALRNRALLHHYRRLALNSSFRSKSWLKTITGSLNWPLLAQTIRGFRPRNPLHRPQVGPDAREYAMGRLRTASARGVRLLHVYSEGDEGLDYFRLILGKEADAQPMALIRGANHTFTPLWSQDQLVQVVCDWAQYFVRPPLRDGEFA